MRRSWHVAELLGRSIAQRIRSYRYRSVKICVSGILNRRIKKAIGRIYKGGLKILSIEQRGALAHNGIKRKRARRM